MKRSALGFYLTLALVSSPVIASAQAPVSDPEVASGIRQAEDGDYDSAIITLDNATRRLSAAGTPSRDLGDAFLYLGVAYLAKGHEISAKARFREALEQVRDLRLSAEKFAPRVIEAFEAARAEMGRAPAATPSPLAPSAAASPIPKQGGSRKGLILVGAGLAVAGGVVAASAGGSSTPDTTTPAATSYRLDGSDTQSLPSRGGSGGGQFQLTCPAGSLMIGLTGQADTNLVTRVAPGCAALLANGTTGPETILALPGPGTGPPFTDKCSAGQAVVRLFGATALLNNGSTIVPQLGLGCASIPEWVGGGGTVTQLTLRGSQLGGVSFTDTCPSGYVVTSLSGLATAVTLDRIAATCTRVRR